MDHPHPVLATPSIASSAISASLNTRERVKNALPATRAARLDPVQALRAE